MSQYFYIFLDFALVFGGLVLLLISAIYAGFYFVVRRTGKRLAAQVNLEVARRLEKERNTRTIPLEDADFVEYLREEYRQEEEFRKQAKATALQNIQDIINNGGNQ